MRIDSNQAAQPPSTDQTGNSNTARSDARTPASNPLGEDQAQLSGSHLQIQALASQVLQFPEIRQEKVNELRQLVRDGSYNPNPSDVADAVSHHILAKPAA